MQTRTAVELISTVVTVVHAVTAERALDARLVRLALELVLFAFERFTRLARARHVTTHTRAETNTYVIILLLMTRGSPFWSRLSFH